MPRRVLVVEDEPEMQVILRDNLEFEGYTVRSARDGEEGFRLANADPPDLILLDILLPRMSGYELCRRIRATNCSVPIIMITARNAEVDRVAGLELGADDYLGKPFGIGELLARIRAQFRRVEQRELGERAETRFGDMYIDWRARRVQTPAGPLDLSSREFDLLEYFVKHAGKVVTREELLTAVWGYGDAAVSRTVDNFVAKLRKKLEPNPHQPAHIITVHGSGYRFIL